MTNTSRSLSASAIALALAASAIAAPSAFAQEADAVAPIESGRSQLANQGILQ